MLACRRVLAHLGRKNPVFDEPAKSSAPLFRLKVFPPIFSMEHLLQALHGVDAPGGQGSPNRFSLPIVDSRNCRIQFFLKFAIRFAIWSAIECRKNFQGSLVRVSRNAGVKVPPLTRSSLCSFAILQLSGRHLLNSANLRSVSGPTDVTILMGISRGVGELHGGKTKPIGPFTRVPYFGNP
jgi:hypothetical protein